MLVAQARGEVSIIVPEWKAHFKATPVIENCAFERKVFFGKGETNLYQFKYQQNAFLLRQIRTLEDVPSNNIPTMLDYEGHFGSNSWAIGWTADSFGILKLFPNSNDIWRKVPEDGNSFVLYAAERLIFKALYYGISDLDPATMEWPEESKFTARSILGQRFFGEITKTDQGRPSALEWRVEHAPDEQFRFVIEYKYDESSNLDLQYYPSEIRVSTKINGQIKMGEAYRVLMLKTSAVPLEENLFDPKRYFVKPPNTIAPRISTLLFSNKEVYDISVGQPEEVLPSSAMEFLESGKVPKTTSKLIRFVLFDFFLISVIGLLVALKKTKTNKKNK